MVCHFEESYIIDAPLETVWAYFEEEDAFEKLMPPWAKAQIVSKTGGLQVGSEVQLKLPFGIPWHVQHTAYKKYAYFVDVQIKGPFHVWKHRHEFQQFNTNKTLLRDSIFFSLPAGWILDYVFGWLIKWQLKRLCAFRKHVLSEMI